MKTSIRVVTTVVVLGVQGVATCGYAADWSDTSVGYTTSNKYWDPYQTHPYAKNIMSFDHVSGDKVGTNVFHMEYLKNKSDPAALALNNVAGEQGASEFYALYRRQFEWGKITGKPAQFGPIKDIGLTLGLDYETINGPALANKQLFVVGPTFQFAVPGLLNVSLLSYNEKNRSGIAARIRAPGWIPNDSFKSTYQIATVWMIPFSIGPAPVKFQGNLNWTASKGKDYYNQDTAPETLMNASLMVDVGQMATGKKNSVWAGIGYQYWNNKYGYQSNAVSGTMHTQHAPTLQLEYHF